MDQMLYLELLHCRSWCSNLIHFQGPTWAPLHGARGVRLACGFTSIYDGTIFDGWWSWRFWKVYILRATHNLGIDKPVAFLDDRWTGALPFCWGYQLHLSGTRTFYLPIMLAQLQFCKTHGQSSLKGFHVELSIAIGGHKSLLTNTLPQQYNPRGHRIRYWIQVPHAQLALPLLKLASWLVIPWTAHSGQS